MIVTQDPRAIFVEATAAILNDLNRRGSDLVAVKPEALSFDSWWDALSVLEIPPAELRKARRAKEFFEAEYLAHPAMVARELELRAKRIFNMLNATEGCAANAIAKAPSTYDITGGAFEIAL